jgi:hypothetical protein
MAILFAVTSTLVAFLNGFVVRFGEFAFRDVVCLRCVFFAPDVVFLVFVFFVVFALEVELRFVVELFLAPVFFCAIFNLLSSAIVLFLPNDFPYKHYHTDRHRQHAERDRDAQAPRRPALQPAILILKSSDREISHDRK